LTCSQPFWRERPFSSWGRGGVKYGFQDGKTPSEKRVYNGGEKKGGTRSGDEKEDPGITGGGEPVRGGGNDYLLEKKKKKEEMNALSCN